MQLENVETFDFIEFEEAVESGMEVSLDGPMSTLNLHYIIIEAFDDKDVIQLECEVAPMEWKTGFVFGVLCGLLQHNLLKEQNSYDDSEFNHTEFQKSALSAGEMMVGELYSLQDIHELIVETVEESLIDDQGYVIPMESKTGFLFGALREIIVSDLVKIDGDSDMTVSDRR